MLKFKGNGKLLLTGEYTILDGAFGVALPTKLGQIMEVEPINEKGIFWTSLLCDKSKWLEFTFKDLPKDVKNTNPIVSRLAMILLKASELNPNFEALIKDQGFKVTTTLEFDASWGLGSSSTLIYCIAKWAEVDAYELLFSTIGGSGYDIACAGSDSPILYSLDGKTPIVSNVGFSPSFIDNLYFVYLNKKQSSESSLSHYGNLTFNRAETVKKITQITEDILKTENLSQFNQILDEHENIVSSILKMKKVKDLHFADFTGSVKSLGAWGGDFVLASSEMTKEDIFAYFKQKGFHTIIPYKEMICQH